MILCDTGPLVALIDKDDRRHKDCMNLLPSLFGPMITTQPCFTEAMYLLGAVGGISAQEKLWGYYTSGSVTISAITDVEMERARVLMSKYRDRPMDYADATMVAKAESLSMTKIFTTDSDFYFYRMENSKSFEVVP